MDEQKHAFSEQDRPAPWAILLFTGSSAFTLVVLALFVLTWLAMRV